MAICCLAVVPTFAQEALVDAWEIGVEVARYTTIEVFDGDGALLVSDSIVPSGSEPDWTADLTDDAFGVDWSYDWENEDTDLLTIRLSGSGFSRTYVYVPVSVRTLGSFWIPPGYNNSPDIVFQVVEEGERAMVKAKTGGFSNNSFEDVFSDSYVHPYDTEYFCTQVTCSTPLAGGYFLSPVNYIPNATTRTFTFASEGNSVYQSGWDSVWDVPNLKLQFHSQRSFHVEGDLDATGVTFTSVDPTPDPSTGWRGLHFESGSSGSLANSVIEGVGGYGGYSLWITNASPDIVGTSVINAAGMGIGGIYITGSAATPTLEGNLIEYASWPGVRITSSARPSLIQNQIRNNNGWGLIAGSWTDPFLSPPIGSTPGPGFFGNIIELNALGGVSASMSAYVTFGWYYYPSGGLHAHGYNSVVDNGGVGLAASTSATVAAGGTYNRMNRIFGNTSNDATASGSGSTVSARCNWWNDTTPPFRTLESGGGLVYDDYYLLQDPYINPYATCVSSGSLMTEGSSRERLVTAAELAGPDPEAALDVLSRILEGSGEDAVVGAALSETAHISSRVDVLPATSVRAMTMLQASAVSSDLTRRLAGRRALVAAHYRRGNTERAIAWAEGLVTHALFDDELLYGHVALAHLYAESGDLEDAMSSLYAAEAIAPRSVEVAIARAELDRPASYRSDQAAGSVPYADIVADRPDDSIGTDAVTVNPADDSGGHTFRVLPAYPNPVRDRALVAFTLSKPALVRLETFDILGRRIGIALSQQYENGRHVATLDVSTVPDGVYFVRATAQIARLGTQTRTLRVSVIH